MVAAKKLGIRASLATVRMKLSVRGTMTFSSPPTNDTAGDPVLYGGSIEIISGDGTFDQVYSLPPSNWTYVGPPGANQGYRYRDRELLLGPIRAVALRDLRASSILAAWPRTELSLSTDPSPVGVILTLGGTRYCMTFGGTEAWIPDTRYTAIDAPAPMDCAR
jgi:hypothetical protein